MIKHIVMFKLAEEAEGRSKAENALYIKSELENLKNIIPQIKMIKVGICTPEAPEGSYDVALVSEFENMEELNTYQIHPEHKRVAAFIGKVRTERACVDYEM
jgi:hypothetical protein